MCPHFAIPFMIAFAFLLFTRAGSQIVQDPEKQPGTNLVFDTPFKWEELVSSFHPENIADNIHEASNVSDLFDVPLTTNSDDTQSESRVPPNSPEGRPELRQHSLEALLAEETENIIQFFQTVINTTAALGTAFYDILESASPDGVLPSNVPSSPLLEKLVELAAIAHDDFRARFPLPAMAPGHAERVKSVSDAVERLQQLVMRLGRHHEQEVIEHHLARVIPFLHQVGVLIGDVVELYPAVMEAIVLNLSAVLLPEAAFLRSLVILYCLGPYVLGRDAIGGWLLKHVSEALRE